MGKSRVNLIFSLPYVRPMNFFFSSHCVNYGSIFYTTTTIIACNNGFNIGCENVSLPGSNDGNDNHCMQQEIFILQ
jgi:hypothetical protein